MERTEKPNGPAAAAFLAAGIGSAALGVFTILAETFEGVGSFLELYAPVGPLSGKTTFAVVVWLVAWGALYGAWRSKEVSWRMVWTPTLVLVGIGFVLTFPLVFLAFAPEE
jgi:branched-subunit amino acid permease